VLSFSNSIEEKLNWLIAKNKEVSLFIKRDDLIHPIISGNKWRKLHLLVEKAIREGKTEIVTFGGAYSNHLLATACAGNLYGINTKGIIRGQEFKNLNPQLSLCKRYGMELCFVSRNEYNNKAMLSEKHQNESNVEIDEGGRDPLAIEGARTIIKELDTEYDYIVLPTGTCTTLEGICKEIRKANLSTKVIAFSALKENNADYKRIKELIELVDWRDETTFGGYGKFNKKLLDFMDLFIQETGIVIDPIYQGKMFYGLANLIKQDYFQPNSKVLCIHTGGNLGLYTNKVNEYYL